MSSLQNHLIQPHPFLRGLHSHFFWSPWSHFFISSGILSTQQSDWSCEPCKYSSNTSRPTPSNGFLFSLTVKSWSPYISLEDPSDLAVQLSLRTYLSAFSHCTRPSCSSPSPHQAGSQLRALTGGSLPLLEHALSEWPHSWPFYHSRFSSNVEEFLTVLLKTALYSTYSLSPFSSYFFLELITINIFYNTCIHTQTQRFTPPIPEAA